jgi:hypothetical protein
MFTTNITFISLKTTPSLERPDAQVLTKRIHCYLDCLAKKKMEVIRAKFEERGWRAVAVAVGLSPPQQQRRM